MQGPGCHAPLRAPSSPPETPMPMYMMPSASTFLARASVFSYLQEQLLIKSKALDIALFARQYLLSCISKELALSNYGCWVQGVLTIHCRHQS